jgi:hypothetical protein
VAKNASGAHILKLVIFVIVIKMDKNKKQAVFVNTVCFCFVAKGVKQPPVLLGE